MKTPALERPWSILKTNPADQPPEHVIGLPWAVLHPRAVHGRKRRITRFATHAEALAFVLCAPEFARRTQRREHHHA